MATLHFLLSLTLLFQIASCFPMAQEVKIKQEEIKHQLLNPEENAILDDDQHPVEAPVSGDVFPDRRGLVTGHRIPLELFSKETIQRLTEQTKVETEAPYVDASDFRKEAVIKSTSTTTSTEPSPLPPLASAFPLASPLAIQPEPIGREFDTAYFATLDAFVHDF